ncbi:hypothetical protein T492DRAFT_562669, partial [Pavlovales sp. CCMP2436]
NRSLCLLELGDLTGAASDCDGVLVLVPTHTKALFRRGLVRERQLRYDEAIADLEVRLPAPRAPSARTELLAAEAQRQGRAGEHMHAIELLTEAIALEPQNASLYEARSRECGAAKKYQAVLHDGERLVELRPELAAGHAISGSALYCLGEFEQATHAYTRATNLEPADKSLEEARNDTAKKLGASLRQAA